MHYDNHGIQADIHTCADVTALYFKLLEQSPLTPKRIEDIAHSLRPYVDGLIVKEWDSNWFSWNYPNDLPPLDSSCYRVNGGVPAKWHPDAWTIWAKMFNVKHPDPMINIDGLDPDAIDHLSPENYKFLWQIIQLQTKQLLENKPTSPPEPWVKMLRFWLRQTDTPLYKKMLKNKEWAAPLHQLDWIATVAPRVNSLRWFLWKHTPLAYPLASLALHTFGQQGNVPGTASMFMVNAHNKVYSNQTPYQADFHVGNWLIHLLAEHQEIPCGVLSDEIKNSLRHRVYLNDIEGLLDFCQKGQLLEIPSPGSIDFEF